MTKKFGENRGVKNMAKMKAGKNLLPVEKGKMTEPQITVVGIGNAGCAVLSRITELEPTKTRLVAVHTNKAKLNAQHDDLIKILLGRSLTQGMGSYGSSDVGSRAAEISQESIKKAFKKTDLAILVAGLGGGTGSGAIQTLTQIAKEEDVFTLAFVTFPFDMERKKQGIAEDAIVQLTHQADAVIVLDHNCISELFPGLKMEDGFNLANEVLGRVIYNITETLTNSSLINLDFTDFKAVFNAKGVCQLAMGSSSSEKDLVNSAVEKTLESLLLHAHPNRAQSVLLTMTAGPEFSVQQANAIGEKITAKIDPSAIVSWSCRTDPDMEGQVEVYAIFAGINSPFKGGRVEAEEGKTSAVGPGKYAIRGKDGKIKKGLIEV